MLGNKYFRKADVIRLNILSTKIEFAFRYDAIMLCFLELRLFFFIVKNLFFFTVFLKVKNIFFIKKVEVSRRRRHKYSSFLSHKITKKENNNFLTYSAVEMLYATLKRKRIVL